MRRTAMTGPVIAKAPSVRAVWEWCRPAREQSWALRGLSGYCLGDVGGC